LTGRFVSPLTPFRRGPRHCGQLSAFTETSDSAAIENESRMRVITGQNIKTLRHWRSANRESLIVDHWIGNR
jgi:hypothetical protein